MVKEFGDYIKFREYLRGLKGAKPFNCPNFAVLPEDVCSYEGDVERRYEKGALICSETPGIIGPVRRNHRCHLNEAEIILNKSGYLETKCGWNSSKFKLKITDFEYSRGN